MLVNDRIVEPVTAVPADYVSALENVVSQRESVAGFVRGKDFRRVYFVGCGASYYATWPALSFMDNASDLPAWRCTGGDFATAPPRRLDRRTLVVAASHSGYTDETIDAARLARRAGATVAAITREQASPLAEVAHETFAYCSNSAIVESRMLLFQLFARSLAHRDTTVFEKLPLALRTAKDEVVAAATEIAGRLDSGTMAYVVGAGPSLGVANAFAHCYLQEMQWIPATAVDATTFFHGPFEAVEPGTPVLVLLAEDGSRAAAERVWRFAENYSGNVAVLDSRKMSLPGVRPADRAELGVIGLGSAARRVVDFLAAARGHDLTTRRYMRRVDY
ncbi:SIS domain-containing protein [Fodinicola feengrottensis]|uniref:Fructosamine deglycase FrlB n=1 Tax=Fodinicola feengrottensis TaxID=435914 RepID=A0ABN2GD14_9ACTN|nr:SIS domain-containing protein [Fodinicola feengrottensis]